MKGILFTPKNIKAVMEGRKTQTRRLIKLEGYDGDEYYEASDGLQWPVVAFARYHTGETVYVKEMWATEAMFNKMTARGIEKTKLATVPLWYRIADYQIDRLDQTQGRWRSPLFMPEWAARTFLKIKDVRPERLQEITRDDALAEGVQQDPLDDPDPVVCYSQLWDSINRKPGTRWADNAWVWRYVFAKTEKVKVG